MQHLHWKVIIMQLTGKYGLAELMQRYGDVQLPPIEIIDTKKVFQKEKGKGDAVAAIDRCGE